MAKPDLSVIFGIGKPKHPGGDKGSMFRDEPEPSRDEYPEGFEDAAEAAFDALKQDDSKEFCRQLYEAVKAFAESEEEETPTEEQEEPEHRHLMED